MRLGLIENGNPTDYRHDFTYDSPHKPFVLSTTHRFYLREEILSLR